MTVLCSMRNCRSKFPRDHTRVAFHRLPMRPDLKESWLEKIRLPFYDRNRKTVYVCSAHFKPEDFNRRVWTGNMHLDECKTRRLRLKTNAVPSILEPARPLTSVDHDHDYLALLIGAEPSPKPIEKDTTLMHDHNYTLSADATKQRLTEQLAVEKAKKRKAQQKLSRKRCKINSQQALIGTLQTFGITENQLNQVQNSLGLVNGDAYTILKHHQANQKKASGRRYTDELLKIAQQLHCLSPRCYSYLRELFSLPSEVTVKMRKQLQSAAESVKVEQEAP